MIPHFWPLAQAVSVSIAWIVAFAILALLTIALAALLRTRLGNMRPWRKCAILSLWVHLLLGCLIAAVRIAAGGPGEGDGYGPPIEVALLPAEVEPVATETPPPAGESTDPPEEPAPSNEEPPADEPPASPSPDEQLDAPHLLDTPAATAEPAEDVELAPPPLTEVAAPPAPTPADPAAAEPSSTESHATAAEPADTERLANPSAQQTGDPTGVSDVAPIADAAPPAGAAAPPTADADVATANLAPTPVAPLSGAGAPTAPVAAVPTPYAARFAANRLQLAEAGGGGANTERAVAAGLAWLAAAQSEDGRWEPRRHGAGQERFVLQQNRGGAGAAADTGISGLALLAFLGAGHTHREGPHAPAVGQGLEFLRRTQHSNGNLCGQAELFAQMYCHSMASFALSEAVALTRDQRLLPAVRAAAGYSLAVQHPTDGGWRYRPGDTGDTSQLGWQVMALRSAEQADVIVPAATWTRVERFLRQVVRGRAGGLAVYRPEEARPSRAMTAEALYCRQLVSGRADGQLNEAALAEAIGSLVEEPPSTRSVNLYYWYYATLALHRAQHASPRAAEAWRSWNDALTHTLLATQRDDGAWPETCLWGGYGGRVYTTALATMCLEVYYRYVPADDAVANRGGVSSAAQSPLPAHAPR